MSRQPEHVRISPRTTPCAALSQIIVSSKIWHETLTSAAAAASAAARRARRSAIARTRRAALWLLRRAAPADEGEEGFLLSLIHI